MSARRCSTCNTAGHDKRSPDCPYHPERRCLDCNEQRQHHRDRGHRFRANKTIGEIVDEMRATP